MPLQLPAWAFWTPMVVLIYIMPPSLQIVLWTGAMAGWSLVMVFIGRRGPRIPATSVPRDA